MANCADKLVEALRDLGIRHVFGLPGGENVQVVDALRRQGLEFILVRNESTAAYAAAALWRVTGVPQACLTTLGPGITHAYAGVGHLWLDRAAVVVITARTAESSGPMHTHQVLDLSSLMAPMVKSTFTVTASNAHMISTVCSLMREGRPGPVHIQISNEVAGATWPSASTTLPENGAAPVAPTALPAPSTADLAQARRLLEEAVKPVMVVGLGVMGSESIAAVQRFADAQGMPVIVTPKAKGVVSDRGDLAAGVIGLTRTDPVYGILDESDLILAIGFDVVELVKPWRVSQPLIWIAPWHNQDPTLPAAVELVGPINGLLDQLVSSAEILHDWDLADVKRRRRESITGLPERCQPGMVSPQHVLEALRGHAREDALLTVDVGSHKIHFSLDWPALRPETFLLSNGLSCMGYGLAGALGAGVHDPERETLCVTGDGGLAMCAGELGLLSERRSNTKIVVMRDQALDLIRAAQFRANRQAIGTEHHAPTDHLALAAAYGIPALQANSPETLDTALKEAFAIQGPFLIEVMIDPASYPTAAPVPAGWEDAS